MPTYIRVKDLPNAATSPASDDFILLSGTANGARRISRADFLSAVAGFYTADPSTYKLATLDAGDKVLVSQLPSAAFSYKGTWAASSNTPSLANGIGTAGDTYYASDSGSVNFGAGSISFLAGDAVVYDGTIWQKVPDVVNLLDGKGTLDEAKTTLEIPTVGLQPNQVPLSGQLGTMAFQDADGVSVGTLEVTDKVDGNLGVNITPVGRLEVALTPTTSATTVNEVADFADSAIISNSGSSNFGDRIPLVFNIGNSGANGISAAIVGEREASGWNSALSFWTNGVTSGPEGTDAIQEAMRIGSSGNVTINNGNLVLSSGAIDFGSTTTGSGTVATNGGLLADYEFGYFTVTAGGTWTVTPTSMAGRYVKVGNLVTCWVTFGGSPSKTSATSGWLEGLPFATNVYNGQGSVSDTSVADRGNCYAANVNRLWLTGTSFGANNYATVTYRHD